MRAMLSGKPLLFIFIFMKKIHIFLIVSALLGINLLLGASQAQAAEITIVSPTITEQNDAAMFQLQEALNQLKNLLNQLQYAVNSGKDLKINTTELQLTLSQLKMNLTGISVALGPQSGASGGNYAVSGRSNFLSSPVLGQTDTFPPKVNEDNSDLAVAVAHDRGVSGWVTQWVMNLRKPFLILLAFTLIFAVVVMLRRSPKTEVAPA